MTLFALALLLVQSTGDLAVATPSAVPLPSPKLEASSSPNFILAAPRLDVHGSTTHIEGAICRRANDTGLSPARVQIERVQIDGTISETRFAFLPPLSRRPDQRCGRYGAAIAPPPQPGETMRVCLAGTGVCPVSH